MNKEKIRWCCSKERGIKIIEPKPHLSASYIKEADETLENVFSAKGKWKAITAYYACYNAIYALLMCQKYTTGLFDQQTKSAFCLRFSIFLSTLKNGEW